MVAEAVISVRGHDDITVLREVSLVLKSSYENTEANTENTCEPLERGFCKPAHSRPESRGEDQTLTMWRARDGCISKTRECY